MTIVANIIDKHDIRPAPARWLERRLWRRGFVTRLSEGSSTNRITMRTRGTQATGWKQARDQYDMGIVEIERAQVRRHHGLDHVLD